jgi:hypothetical protein
VIAVWASLLAASGSSCAPRDAQGLCRGQGECDKDSSCIVGRCRPRAEPAVAPGARRVVLEPSEIAVVSSKERERVEVPALGFGRIASGEVALLLSFEDEIGGDVEIERAFLVLDPLDDAPSPVAPVPIEVAPIREAWSRDSVSWARKPATGLAEIVADASPRAHKSLRVEVTELLVSTEGHHGFALSAGPRDPIGAFYATGLGGGAPPRLELYLKAVESHRPEPSASASAGPSPSASSGPSPDASARRAAEEAPPHEKKPTVRQKTPKK